MKSKINKVANVLTKVKRFVVGGTKQKKLDIILDHLIDSIELRGDDVLITTKKNIAIKNEGHLVQINSGVHVLLSKEIHLNPSIDFDADKDFSGVQEQLDYARSVEDTKIKEKVLKAEEENHKICDHS